MSESQSSPHLSPNVSDTDYDQSKRYEICIKGHLDPRWTDWFEGLIISHENSGNTRLTGPITDQAALHGLLAKIRDLGLPLISLMPISPSELTRQASHHPESSHPKSSHKELLHQAPPQALQQQETEKTNHAHTSTTIHSKPEPI